MAAPAQADRSAPNVEPTDPALGLFTILGDGSKPPRDVDLDDRTLLAIYEELLRIRVIDTRMMLLQRQGRVGFYGACTGQEAVPIACAFATKPTDWIFPALREQAIMLVRGFPLHTFIAQVFGNGGDVLKGRQMPSHMSGRSVNQVSWSSCIGPQLPHAVGAAWAAKLRHAARPVRAIEGENEGAEMDVVLGFCGDGATSEPDFHAALTFAGVHKTPSVIVCQNNHWSISVPTARQTASATLAIKGKAYGVPSVRVDGNDVLAVHHVVRDAVHRARHGDGPTFVECVTYRIGAHSSSDDPTRYRSNEEVEHWKKKDPIERFHAFLVARGTATQEDRKRIEEAVDATIVEAIKAVEPLAPPPRESMFQDVYAEMPWHLREQCDELLAAPTATGHHSGGH